MRLQVRVITRAKKERIENLADGSLKVWVSVVREKGKANARVIELLAEHFGKSKSRIAILSGQTSNNKLIEIAE